MFHFPGCPPIRLWIHLMVTGHYPSRVPPFGDPRINAYLRLPLAYRSLSRPSSAISAMASTLRSCSLDLASSRRSPPPKTSWSGSRLRLFSCFVSSLCSFQGAVEVSHFRLLFRALRLFDPSKRYRKVSVCFSQIPTPAFITDYLFDTSCRCCRFRGLPVFPASCTSFLKCRPRI